MSEVAPDAAFRASLRETGRMVRVLSGLAMLVGVLIADQFSKYWILHGFDLPRRGSVAILPFLNFTMVWNRAVTFGMFGGVGRHGPFVFSTISLIAVAALIVALWRSRKLWLAIAIGAIAGGAVGNVIDRLRFGAVVDFLHVHSIGVPFPWVFNVADSAIVCGVIVWAADSLLRREPS